MSSFFFFFNDTATTEIYTLSLHDALPISALEPLLRISEINEEGTGDLMLRSEEHTSELQSLRHLVCRLLLEKKKNNQIDPQVFIENFRLGVFIQFSCRQLCLRFR